MVVFKTVSLWAEGPVRVTQNVSICKEPVPLHDSHPGLPAGPLGAKGK